MEVEQIFCSHKWSRFITGWEIVPVDVGLSSPINDHRPIYIDDTEWCHLCGEKRPIVSTNKYLKLNK